MIGNGAPEFKVIYADNVRDYLQLLAKRAQAAGKGQVLLQSLKALDLRLKQKPTSFGERLYYLKEAKLEVRLGVEGFLAIRFGIHTEKKLVFVMACHLLGDPGF